MLHLIKADEIQNKWALVIDNNVQCPTIHEYKQNPHLYNAMIHGFYSITFAIDDIWATDGGIRIKILDKRFKIQFSQAQIFSLVSKGFVSINGDTVTCTGRFKKNGSEINFYPGGE
ncbi:hypothetical protein AVV36_gp192 [Pectobacterium bacteriophage PM2]|uniref:Uncharacterized protein n=1 Tax=Pectobacterium bacteriophage PM2 TaxID=1429794 RepID=A0A0A0Q0X7_9CAUD|nr:hypothetical protein AVV36_gp192 [Pectobacterium bacteriophage PM2]AHY25218.1 hypothetical protein PM2_256 [Pectobacterium bacteriophage PM2]